MSHSFDEFPDQQRLRQLAGETAYERGEDCFVQGRVRHLSIGPDRVSAQVYGARVYRVKIWRSRGEVQCACNCPAGREDRFCEHCVAVGLACLANNEPPTEPGGDPQTTATGEHRSAEAQQLRERLAAHLETLGRDRLMSLVLEATDYDEILRRRLELEAVGIARTGGARKSSRRAAEPDLETYARLLREAIHTADPVDYDAMPDYAQGVEEAIRPLRDLLRDGFAAAVIDLTELALVELDRNADLLDGGDGSLNAIYDDLQRYHLEACRAAAPDPEALAARLLDYELEGGLGVFNNALNTYGEILGERGLQAWRQHLEREWNALPPLTAGQGIGTGGIDHRRFQVQALMARLAEGNRTMQLAVRRKDLSNAYDYLALAEWIRADGDLAAAIECAEEGRRLFPAGDDDAGLEDFLIRAYEASGRHEDARQLAWDAFARSGDLSDYRRLRRLVGEPAQPATEWTAWRERAITQLRERITRARTQARERGVTHVPDHSALVEIFLEEGLIEAAWREANVGGARAELWLQLATCREVEHPADALRVYQSRLEPTIALGGQTAYREAMELLDKIRTLLERLGRSEDFEPFRAGVRAAHRQKRNFLKLLDASDS